MTHIAVLLYHVVRVLSTLLPIPTFEPPEVAVRTVDVQNQRLLVHLMWSIDVAPLHTSNLLPGVVLHIATHVQVSNTSELTRPLPPGPNFGI